MSAVVLAAGQGTRMRSRLPKPLHPLGGRAMVGHVLDALSGVRPDRATVVVGHGADELVQVLHTDEADVPIDFVTQPEQRGTGDAVRVALDAMERTDGAAGSSHAGGDTDVLVLPGDTPLLRAGTLVDLVASHRAAGTAATVLTARVDDPTGYGRILRDGTGAVTGIVEESDASEDQRPIDEVNTAIYVFRRDLLADALGRIRPDNAQGEWYLTDVLGVLHDDGRAVGAFQVADPDEVRGVNDRVQLADAAAVLRARINADWMRAGVTLVDPPSTHIEPSVHIAGDVTVHPGVVLGGATEVGEGAEIGPHVVATDAHIGAGARIGASAVLEPGAQVAAGDTVAPLTRIEGNPTRPRQ